VLSVQLAVHEPDPRSHRLNPPPLPPVMAKHATSVSHMCYLDDMKAIGIRELRQNASQIIEAAEGGATYRVTNHGRDTGVLIGKQQHAEQGAGEERTGASPDQIMNSGVYDSPKPATYEEEMLRLVQHGRDQSGRVGGP
jgi:prevent-host-death family protein